MRLLSTRGWIGLLALTACSGSDPELDPIGQALTAWERGAKALEEGRSQDALSAFAEARVARPDDALLAAWEARALADLGRLDEALERLDQLLDRHPSFWEGRYNRAAYRARAGRVEEAAEDLRAVLRAGLRTPRDATADPDFAAVLDHPAMAFLPRRPVEARVTVDEGLWFWGSEVALTLDVLGVEADAALDLRAPALPPLVSLVRVVEDARDSDADPVRTVQWTARVEQAGEARLGPWDVRLVDTDREAHVDAIPVSAEAPPGKEATAETFLGGRWLVPSQLQGARDVPSVWRQEGALIALTPPGCRLELPSELADRRRLSVEMRQSGEPQAEMVLVQLSDDAPEVAVRILQRGEALFEGPVAGPEPATPAAPSP